MAQRDISFSSFNLLNLQLPGQAIYGDTDGWDQDIYDKKVDFTAKALTRLAADVIGFQELWAADALDDVLAASGLDATHTALTDPGHDGESIINAAAIRSDILRGTPEWIVEFPDELVLQSTGDDPQQADIAVRLDSFSRPVLHCQVQIRDDTPVIHVFVCHFKSRRPTQLWREAWYDRDIHSDHRNALGYAVSTIRRTAEAAALRVLITKVTKNSKTPVVVIGDMNDGKSSNTLNILTEQPNFLPPTGQGGGDNALYTVQKLQEFRSLRDVYYTHVFKEQRESLDHILVSEEFYDNSTDRLWIFDEMTVENDHLNFDDHKESGTTDHGIIRAAFKWRPAPTASS
ncbi:MAG: endonuclease/exonuclease/phosphatase family protein [Pseudomonadota bacterium]